MLGEEKENEQTPLGSADRLPKPHRCGVGGSEKGKKENKSEAYS